MVTEALKAVLERGFGVGEHVGEGVGSGFAEHPICGDRVQLSVQHADGVIHSVRWRADGCPASMAIAALAAEVLVDVPVEDLATALHQAIGSHGGLARHEHHAEAMVIRALREAIGANGTNGASGT
tara:strand:- start:57815 stop:58192 length:378 start_codon:yes stop_codon:yes gene_type:complete